MPSGGISAAKRGLVFLPFRDNPLPTGTAPRGFGAKRRRGFGGNAPRKRKHDLPQTNQRQHRWGAASDVKRVQITGGLDFVPPAGDLCADRVRERPEQLRVPVPAGDFRIKITIGAETPAKRDVQIDH